MRFKKLLESKKEYVIWGCDKNNKDETVLYTKAKSESEAKKVMKILKTKYGAHNLRLQILDFGEKLDFMKGIKGI